jgi:hydrogenase/urease accessory protein HupE
MIRAMILVLAVMMSLLPMGPAAAHEVRPGYLELRERDEGLFATTWKVPALGEFRLAIAPVFPDFCQPTHDPVAISIQNASIEHGEIRCTKPLAGDVIRIRGLEATQTDVLVRIQFANGHVDTDRLTPSSTSVVVRAEPAMLDVLRTYVLLGVEHILTGTDHLLFVLCLILLVKEPKRLLATVTAFTLAHSISLVAATLGFIHVPSVPVEATIALSIVFLAQELAKGGGGITRSYPWLVAFCFGLLHGLGFAGALAEVGLPDGDIPLALFSFNVGVEIGQLAFIAVVLTLGWCVRRGLGRLPTWTTRAASYAIGATASFWMLERIATG